MPVPKSNKIRTKISTFSIIPSDKFKENYFFEMSTLEFLRYNIYLRPSFKTKTKMQFYRKAKQLINKYSNVENLIYYIQQSETLKNYLIKNQDKFFLIN